MSQQRTRTGTGTGTGQSFVVGTAGHIDHGKSTLVMALTGIDPDRLAEEKARGMTIDLGFAWLESPAGRQISIVDVPGHERFIKNMLAGVGGIDAAILVIAADEGPMPQTDEHLAILDLLQIRLGVIALTKSDLVDADWLELVEAEVRERVAGTLFAAAPIVPLSALTGAGLPELLALLDAALDAAAPWPSGGKPRLPVDRVFSVQGFGTVVTGTLLGGDLQVGQELVALPAGSGTRVRGLQTHRAKVDRASPGSRVAVNISNLGVDQIHRGDVLTVVGAMTTTQRIDVRLRLLPSAPLALSQNDQVDFFVGAAEAPAWLTLLDREKIEPGDTAWVQLRFRQPMTTLRGDRFIVRRASPSVTIGGGEVIDAAPVRHRRFRPDVLLSLETMLLGSPDEIVLQAISTIPRDVKSLRANPPSGLTASQLGDALIQLIAEGDALALGGRDAAGDDLKPADFVIAKTGWETLLGQITGFVDGFHRHTPLRRGMPKEELRSRLALSGPARLFDDAVASAVAERILADDGQTVRRAAFAITLDPPRVVLAARYLAALEAAPFSPPAPAELGVDPDTLGAMVELGRIVKIGDGVYFTPEAAERIETGVLDLIDRDGSVTLAGFRDHFGTSRKYAQAALEHLDLRRVTRRVGDERVRFAGPKPKPTGGPSE